MNKAEKKTESQLIIVSKVSEDLLVFLEKHGAKVILSLINLGRVL